MVGWLTKMECDGKRGLNCGQSRLGQGQIRYLSCHGKGRGRGSSRTVRGVISCAGNAEKGVGRRWKWQHQHKSKLLKGQLLFFFFFGLKYTMPQIDRSTFNLRKYGRNLQHLRKYMNRTLQSLLVWALRYWWWSECIKAVKVSSIVI